MSGEWWEKGRCEGMFYGNIYMCDMQYCNDCRLLAHCRTESNERAGVEQ